MNNSSNLRDYTNEQLWKPNMNLQHEIKLWNTCKESNVYFYWCNTSCEFGLNYTVFNQHWILRYIEFYSQFNTILFASRKHAGSIILSSKKISHLFMWSIINRNICCTFDSLWISLYVRLSSLNIYATHIEYSLSRLQTLKSLLKCYK